MKEVVAGFKAKWGVPWCAGSIDNYHTPITAPSLSHTDYNNRKGWYSMLLKAVANHNRLFRDLCIEWPASVHDARVLANSSLHKKVNNGKLLRGEEIEVDGEQLCMFLLGDSAYLFHPWVVKPFKFSPLLTQEQKRCNYRLSQARVVVEIAFGRLKGRWRRLSKKLIWI